MKKTYPLLHVVTILFLTIFPVACTTNPSSQLQSIPLEFQPLYNELKANLDEFTQLLTVQQGVGFKPLVLGAQLPPLPIPTEELSAYLQRLADLGAGAIALQIPYPLLAPEHPAAAQNLQYYQRVAESARQSGLLLLINTGVDPDAFAIGSQAKIPIATLAGELRLHNQTIIAEIAPDYLTILNEPDRLALIADGEVNPDAYSLLLNTILTGLDPGSVLLGAGAGNWNDLEYFEIAAQEERLHYLDMHITLTGRSSLVRLFEVSEIARQNQRRLFIGQAWLQKSAQVEAATLPASDAAIRNAYSFWEALDARFLTLLDRYAQQNRVDLLMISGTPYFFSYLEYETTLSSLPASEIEQLIQQAALAAMQTGELTQPGQVFQDTPHR